MKQIIYLVENDIKITIINIIVMIKKVEKNIHIMTDMKNIKNNPN